MPAEVEPECSGQPGTILQADPSGIVVACGDRALRVGQLQREGGRRMSAQDFLAGNELPVGARLQSRQEPG